MWKWQDVIEQFAIPRGELILFKVLKVFLSKSLHDFAKKDVGCWLCQGKLNPNS